MKRSYFLTTALVVAGLALPALSQSFNDQALESLRADGWTPVEMKSGPTQTKVEAVQGDRKLEVVWDRTTGAILKQETEPFTGTLVAGQRVEIDTRNRDFVDGIRGDDDDEDDANNRRGRGRDSNDDDDRDDDRDDRDDDDRDDNRGHGSGDDDHDDDNSGRGNSGDDDGDRDNSGHGGGDDDGDDSGHGGGDDDGGNSGPGGGDDGDGGGDDD